MVLARKPQRLPTVATRKQFLRLLASVRRSRDRQGRCCILSNSFKWWHVAGNLHRRCWSCVPCKRRRSIAMLCERRTGFGKPFSDLVELTFGKKCFAACSTYPMHSNLTDLRVSAQGIHTFLCDFWFVFLFHNAHSIKDKGGKKLLNFFSTLDRKHLDAFCSRYLAQ